MWMLKEIKAKPVYEKIFEVNASEQIHIAMIFNKNQIPENFWWFNPYKGPGDWDIQVCSICLYTE